MRSKACPRAARLLILAPLVRGRKGTYQAVLEEIRKSGFRARPRGRQVHELDEEIEMDRYKIHTIEAVVDRLVIRHPKNRRRRAIIPLAPDRFGGNRAQVRRRLPDRAGPVRKSKKAQDLTCISPSTWPARSTASACRRSSRAPSRSTPRTAPARSARAWASSWRSTRTC
jgi:excinuclease UvrABC ATPase subunit